MAKFLGYTMTEIFGLGRTAPSRVFSLALVPSWFDHTAAVSRCCCGTSISQLFERERNKRNLTMNFLTRLALLTALAVPSTLSQSTTPDKVSSKLMIHVRV